MIEYSQHILGNGLTVLANRDRWSKVAAVNMLYRAGAVVEEPEKTGLAHLMEHLMFRGTRRVRSFDRCVQEVCGESNAFTTADYTDFYLTVPKENLPTALWLEADRAKGLDISARKLAAERSVVVEEFNQRFLNQPYGDQWHRLRRLVYGPSHPYSRPVIGLAKEHILSASKGDVEHFYRKYYTLSNAILSVSADIPPEEVFAAAERYFGVVESHAAPSVQVPDEEPITSARRAEVEADVPADQITVAFLMERRAERGYYICDFMTDMLAGGDSSRMYLDLVKERRLFSAVNAYITGEQGQGMLVLTGQLSPKTTIEQAEAALWEQIERLKKPSESTRETDKIKNKFEAATAFGELNVMNKAMNLSFYRMLGNMELLNGETAVYRSITAAEVADYAARNLLDKHSATLIYRRK